MGFVSCLVCGVRIILLLLWVRSLLLKNLCRWVSVLLMVDWVRLSLCVVVVMLCSLISVLSVIRRLRLSCLKCMEYC